MTKVALSGIALSGLLGEIAEVAGTDAALQVAKAQGGGEAYIPLPHNLTEEHWLVAAVGLASARKIAERVGGGAMDIPYGPLGGLRRRVWAAIRQGLSEGKSVSQVARQVGVTENTVRRHKTGRLGARVKDDRQLDLFHASK